MESMVIRGEYRLLPFLALCKKLNILWHFEIFVNTGPYGAEFQSAIPPTVFIHCHSNFMRTLATKGEYRLVHFLAIGQIKKKMWHFEILTWESMGKS